MKRRVAETMGQEPLFYENFRGAIRHLIGTLGGPKVVGSLLRPTLGPQQAANWINDCLSEDRVSKLDFEDIERLLELGRERGIHCAMWQLCDSAGYEHPDIAPKQTEAQKRARRMRELLDEFARLADEEAAEQRIRSVK